METRNVACGGETTLEAALRGFIQQTIKVQWIFCDIPYTLANAFNHWSKPMSKSQDSKKSVKKAPAKTMMEKRAEKKAKKADKNR